ALAGLCKPGGTYEMQYNDKDFGRGSVLHLVESVREVMPPQQPPQLQQPIYGTPQLQQRGNSGSAAAQPAQVPQAVTYGYRTDPINARQMFICGAINAALHGHGLAAINTVELGQAVDALDVVCRSKRCLGRTQTAM